jgi:hypothetical protein
LDNPESCTECVRRGKECSKREFGSEREARNRRNLIDVNSPNGHPHQGGFPEAVTYDEVARSGAKVCDTLRELLPPAEDGSDASVTRDDALKGLFDLFLK